MGRYLVMSEGGDGVGLCLRLKLEGHEAELWHRSAEAEKHGAGLVDMANSYRMGQTVIADCTGMGLLLDKFRDEGIRTFAGSAFADRLETDRQFAEDLMQAAGIEVPLSMRVSSWEEARAAVEKIAAKSDDNRVVLKPEGSLSGNLPSYVASDVADAFAVLEHWKCSTHGDVKLTIQQFIAGQDVSTEGWFNGEEWIVGLFNHTLEKKHTMNGDVGPSGGCSGNVVWRCSERDPVVRETLLKLTAALTERRYCGPIDINCVVNERGVYGLEFTPRFGYDSFPSTLSCLMDFDFGAFADDCARGDLPDVALTDGFASGIRLSLPPWPSEQHDAASGVAVRGLEEDDWRWFYPYNVMREGEELVSSGGAGIIGVVSGKGEVIGEGFARAEEIIVRLKIPDVQYRTDLTTTFRDCYRELLRILSGEERQAGWYGVDLDGTLAYGSRKAIGDPVPRMVSRIKRWLDADKEVRIFTARAAGKDRSERLVRIYDWMRENLGFVLEVTAEKDMHMIELWDDRAVEVERNEGVAV